jgi:hypothetical protein
MMSKSMKAVTPNMMSARRDLEVSMRMTHSVAARLEIQSNVATFESGSSYDSFKR